MGHVFISYSTKNTEYALKLAKKLRDEGFDVWMDNAKLRASDKWWQSIVLALKDCGAFIVVMTPESKESSSVQREVLLAEKWGKLIFPILLAGENWEFFVDTQYENVIKDVGTSPQYAGKMPSKNFIDELTSYVPRTARGGTDVTAPQSANADELDLTLVEQIATPPEIEESMAGIQPKKPMPTWVLPIVLAIIACSGTIIGSAIGIIPDLLGIFRSSTPTAVVIAPTISATETPLLTIAPMAVPLMNATSVVPTTLVTAMTIIQVAPTATDLPLIALPTLSESVAVTVIRGRGVVAIITNQATNMSELGINFGTNERYILGDILPDSATSAAGQTWCLRQPENAASIDSCTSSNTYTTPATGNSWRNEDIIFRWQGTEIGICEARSSETAPYDCEPLLIDR